MTVKIVETLSSNEATSEKKTIHTPPLLSIQSWGVGCFLQIIDVASAYVLILPFCDLFSHMRLAAEGC